MNIHVFHGTLKSLKKSDENFVSFITNCDSICLSDTWTTKTSKIDIDPYANSMHSHRRIVNKRRKEIAVGR